MPPQIDLAHLDSSILLRAGTPTRDEQADFVSKAFSNYEDYNNDYDNLSIHTDEAIVSYASITTALHLFVLQNQHQRTRARHAWLRHCMHVPNVSTSTTGGFNGIHANNISFVLLLLYLFYHPSVCVYSMHSFKRSELMNINNNFYQKLHKGTLTHTRPYPPTNYSMHTRFSIPSANALNHT